MRKTAKTLTKTMTTLFASLMLAATAFAMPANAIPKVTHDGEWQGVPYAYPPVADTPAPAPLSETDLWAASAQYQARDGFSAVHALGAGNYTVLNLDIPGEGVAADLSNGTCPGPIRYTDATAGIEYASELGECGGWDRFGWLKEGHIVRLSGKLSGNYMVSDVLPLGAPGNTKLSFTDTPDVVLMVNNINAQNELYMFGLIDYTKRNPQNVV